MSRTNLSRRLVILEGPPMGRPELTPAWARRRVEELRLQGREADEVSTEQGGLFSPRQLCRMVDLQKEIP